MKVVTSLRTLLRLAHELAQARKSGDKSIIDKAQKAHDAYVILCRESDEMSTGLTYGAMYSQVKDLLYFLHDHEPQEDS